MFLYGRRTPSMDDKFLYHFTTAEALVKILEGMSLKLSTFSNLNDLNEIEINCSYSNSINYLKIKKFIKEHCKIISYTKNFKKEGTCQIGCNHPRMWSQYSENNKGACLVLNEKFFLNNNNTILKDVFWKVGNVKYSPIIEDENITTDGFIPKQFIKKNFKYIFYKKQIDWKEENERRFLCIDGPDYLSILDSIEFICLGFRFSDEDYLKLAITLTNKRNACFLKLTPHEFVKQVNVFGRSLPVDHAGKIVEIIRNQKNGADEYIDFLRQNRYTI